MHLSCPLTSLNVNTWNKARQTDYFEPKENKINIKDANTFFYSRPVFLYKNPCWEVKTTDCPSSRQAAALKLQMLPLNQTQYVSSLTWICLEVKRNKEKSPNLIISWHNRATLGHKVQMLYTDCRHWTKSAANLHICGHIQTHQLRIYLYLRKTGLWNFKLLPVQSVRFVTLFYCQIFKSMRALL